MICYELIGTLDQNWVKSCRRFIGKDGFNTNPSPHFFLVNAVLIFCLIRAMKLSRALIITCLGRHCTGRRISVYWQVIEQGISLQHTLCFIFNFFDWPTPWSLSLEKICLGNSLINLYFFNSRFWRFDKAWQPQGSVTCLVLRSSVVPLCSATKGGAPQGNTLSVASGFECL